MKCHPEWESVFSNTTNPSGTCLTFLIKRLLEVKFNGPNPNPNPNVIPNQPSIFLFIDRSTYPSIHIHPSIDLSIYRSIDLSVYLSIYLPIRPSIRRRVRCRGARLSCEWAPPQASRSRPTSRAAATHCRRGLLVTSPNPNPNPNPNLTLTL